DFGLLHHDALCVLDEVQLMDVGLVTSVQLAQFRRDLSDRALRPCHTWWMSATLRPEWLRTADAQDHVDSLSRNVLEIPSEKRRGGVWDGEKSLTHRPDVARPVEIARLALEQHAPGTLTLVIVNRVRDALEVYDALESAFREGRGRAAVRRADAPDVELIHS